MAYSDEREPRRLITSITLTEDRSKPHSRAGLVGALAETMSSVIARIQKALWPNHPVTQGQQDAQAAARDITTMALEAAVGKLESGSLQGEATRALIVSQYAAARKANAEAAHIDEQTAALRVERALKLANVLGTSVQVVRLPNGGTVLTVGDDMSLSLPSLSQSPGHVIPPPMEDE